MTGPLVVVGAHRSGTTLVARILRELGIDMGRHVSPLCEDRAIVGLHEWLLRRAGGSWEYPAPLAVLLAVPELRSEARLILEQHESSQRKRVAPWGWKDPRTAFTLGLWASVLPDLQVIVVRRHPGATAASLSARARAEPAAGRSALATRRLSLRMKEIFSEREQHFYRSVRCWEPDAALEVWTEYNTAIDDFISTERERVIADVRLEDLLAEPADGIIELGHRALGTPQVNPARVLRKVQLRVPAIRPTLWPSADAMRRTEAQANAYGYSYEH